MTPGTTRHKRPTVGLIFVIISCLSLQFGAAFAVHLFRFLVRGSSQHCVCFSPRSRWVRRSGLPGAGGRIGQVHKPHIWQYPQKHPTGS